MLIFTALTFVFNFASAAMIPCGWNLENLPATELERLVARTEINRARINVYIQQIKIGLTLMECWGKRSHAERDRLVARHITSLSSAMTHFTLGHEPLARDLLESVVADLENGEGPHLEITDLERDVSALAKRWEVETSLAEFVRGGSLSPMAALVQSQRAHRETGLGVVTIDPRQAETIALALQYVSPAGDAPALQLSDEENLVAQGLSHFVGQPVVNATLEDVFPADSIPGSSALATYLEKLGPFRLVFAIDGFAASRLRGLVDPAEVARQLRAFLAPGGTVILVQAKGEEPVFSREHAERVGLRVLRWDDPRPLPRAWSQVLPRAQRNARWTQVRAYVLRHPAFDRLAAQASVKTYGFLFKD